MLVEFPFVCDFVLISLSRAVCVVVVVVVVAAAVCNESTNFTLHEYFLFPCFSLCLLYDSTLAFV